MLKPGAPNSTKRRIILYNQRFTKVWGIMLSPLPMEIAFQIKLCTSITHLISLYIQGLQNISFGVLHTFFHLVKYYSHKGLWACSPITSLIYL